MSKFSTKPLHEQLREALVARIASGEWKAGETLPNEKDLASHYGLSPGTVRRALQWMEDARLVLREQGRGTFVADAADAEHRKKYERLRTLDGHDFPRSIEVIEVTEAPACAQDCTRLGLPPASLVRRTTCIHRWQGKGYLFETLVVPAELFPVDKLSPDARWDLIVAAKSCGVILGAAKEQISVSAPPGGIASSLGLGAQEAALRIEGTICALDGRPVQWREAFCNTSLCYYLAEAA